MKPRIYDPGDLNQYDGTEVVAIDREGASHSISQADAHATLGDGVTWSVFLHLTAGHVDDLADGFATERDALAFAAAVDTLLPNLRK